MVWGSFLIAAAALKTPTRNGYNAQGVNLTFPPPPQVWLAAAGDATGTLYSLLSNRSLLFFFTFYFFPFSAVDFLPHTNCKLPLSAPLSQVWLAAAGDAGGNLAAHGGLYYDDLEAVEPNGFTNDKDVARRLWDATVKLAHTDIVF